MINHICFIMDGNRRFGKKNNLSLNQSYEAGMRQFVNFVKFQVKYKIYEASYWALSTQNWKRRNFDDLNSLFSILDDFFLDFDKTQEFFLENKIKIFLKGNIKELESKESSLDEKQKKIFANLKKRFDNYNKKIGDDFNFCVNICLNYGGHQELVFAFKNILKKIENKTLSYKQICEKTIKENLYFNKSNSPQIIVRAGNVPRLSGFMSWDCAYSEIYFSKKLWPELIEEDFKEILNWFSKIQRNFGK